jgi:hypothetical protein
MILLLLTPLWIYILYEEIWHLFPILLYPDVDNTELIRNRAARIDHI